MTSTVLALLVMGFALAGCEESRKQPRVDGPMATLSEGARDSVRAFWAAYRKAVDLRLAKKWPAAAEAYAAALEYDPDHEDALYAYGNVLFEEGSYRQAIAAWVQLTQVNASSARAYSQLGALYSCGIPGAPFDLARADAMFRAVLKVNREETGPLLKRGEVALMVGQIDSARHQFSMVLQANSRSREALAMRCYLWWQEGQREKAVRQLTSRLPQDDLVPGQPLGEGATRAGSSPMLAEGAFKKTYFAPFYESVGRLMDPDNRLPAASAFQRADSLMLALPAQFKNPG